MTPLEDYPGLYAEKAFQCWSNLERDYVLVIQVRGEGVCGFLEFPIEYFTTPERRQGWRRRQGPARLVLWEVVAPNTCKRGSAPSRPYLGHPSKSRVAGDT